jgi:adenylate kinase
MMTLSTNYTVVSGVLSSTRIRGSSSSGFPEQVKGIIIFPPKGKGTHSFKLSQRYCLCHLATGDMLRNEVSQGTEFGKKVKSIMSEGGLVSDDMMIDLISNNLSKYSFIT